MASKNGKGISASAAESIHIAGLVLARGGSVQIPRKNIRIVAGLPLLAWVLVPLKKCQRISSVWVSTDDAEIAETALQWGAKIHYRCPDTAKDHSSSFAGVQDFLKVHPDENTAALNFDPKNRPRRQEWPGELVESGHFYFAKICIIEQGLLQGGRCGYVEMPDELCFEIDSNKDLVIAEELLKLYGNENLKQLDKVSIH